MAKLAVPPGYSAVRWADYTVHGINRATWSPASGPLWDSAVVCGASEPGANPDEGPDALDEPFITCDACIGILS